MNRVLSRRHFLGTVGVTAGLGLTPRWLRRSRANEHSPSTYTNSILRGDYPDPTIVRVGDEYYMTHCGGNWCPVFLIWRSRNLVDWQPVRSALHEYGGSISAPELTSYAGHFYIYYETAGGNHAIVADRIEGPWSRPHKLDLPHIDPGHIATPQGQRYLHVSGGYAVELAPDGLSTAGPLRKVFEPWPIPEDWNIECVCLESPKLFYRDGYYHLLVAQGGTAGPPTGHMTVHARSRTPIGPWEYSPYNPIVHTSGREEKWWSCGHATAVEAPDGSWWLIYHAYENGYYTLGRHTMMEPLEWTPDGWFRVRQGIDRARPIPRPNGPVQPVRIERSDDFSSHELGVHWQFWGENPAGHYRLAERMLHLEARGASPGEGRIVTCKVGDHAYVAEVEVAVDKGAEAGLLLFYSPQCYAGVSLGAKGASAYALGGPVGTIGLPAGHGGRCALRLVNDHHDVAMYFRASDGRWTKFERSWDTSGYQHNVFGGFDALRVALFASGQGEARFSRFSYRPA